MCMKIANPPALSTYLPLPPDEWVGEVCTGCKNQEPARALPPA